MNKQESARNIKSKVEPNNQKQYDSDFIPFAKLYFYLARNQLQEPSFFLDIACLLYTSDAADE